MLPDSLQDVEVSVSQFVALLNQTLEFAYPSVIITGELSNFRVSKNRWVYFDLKDETSSVKFFGTVYQLPGPLEDGLILKVRGQPKLHNLYGFSVNIISMQPAGEGSLRRAADLLFAKLEIEGLFDESRKRGLPYPPKRIGLVTSKQSAAYADFIKIINARWQGLDIELIDVQVQGEAAISQIGSAIKSFNAQADPPDVLVLIRGGGSAEDLAAFNTEIVTRAVAASRVPTIVAIGHEIDTSLAELVADRRASTPSNAAELLVPDRKRVLEELHSLNLDSLIDKHIKRNRLDMQEYIRNMDKITEQIIRHASVTIEGYSKLLSALNPAGILRRGYAIVRKDGKVLRSVSQITQKNDIQVQLVDGYIEAAVNRVEKGKYV